MAFWEVPPSEGWRRRRLVASLPNPLKLWSCGLRRAVSSYLVRRPQQSPRRWAPRRSRPPPRARVAAVHHRPPHPNRDNLYDRIRPWNHNPGGELAQILQGLVRSICREVLQQFLDEGVICHSGSKGDIPPPTGQKLQLRGLAGLPGNYPPLSRAEQRQPYMLGGYDPSNFPDPQID